MFYAYCGTNYEDAVAIDNIRSQTRTPEPTTPVPRYCQDYSLCSCSLYSNNKFITCYSISVETVRDVFLLVNDPEIDSLSLSDLLADDAKNIVSLPPDFLSNTRVTGEINIYGSYSNWVIDPLAFRLSQNSLAKLTVYNCNFGLQKDFNFLNGFNKLEELNIYNTINMTAFQYLPPLPSLQILRIIYFSSELNRIAFPDLSPAKLKNLELWGNRISDEKADEIVAKLAASTSADSLEKLDLNSNFLTRIPSQVGSAFPKLKEVDLSGNYILHIPSSSLTFASPYLEILDLYENGIKTIESGAFVGINRLLSEQERIIIRVLLFL